MKISGKLLFVCCAAIYVVASAGNSFANSVVWADDFSQSQVPTLEQCQKWHDFLDQLAPDKGFTSVTMKGSYDAEGITMTDPAAVQELAYLLYTRTDGSVTSDGHTWYVYTGCNLDSCVPRGQGVELRIDTAEECRCPNSQNYTVRPDIGNANWGGVNTASCGAESQTMMIEFRTHSDSDADGVGDGEDLCSPSNLARSVAVGSCDSGVPNTLFANGCTVNDLISKCAENAANHGQFVNCVSGQIYDLTIEGVMSGKEKGAIQKCVAKSNKL